MPWSATQTQSTVSRIALKDGTPSLISTMIIGLNNIKTITEGYFIELKDF